mgnify:CR=1 FL=1
MHMDIEALLPRPLDPQSGLECPTILGAMLTASHFERAKARALGWRGILPSVSETPGWTCKIAGSPHVFGLVFAGERVIGDKYIEGIFSPSPRMPFWSVSPWPRYIRPWKKIIRRGSAA